MRSLGVMIAASLAALSTITEPAPHDTLVLFDEASHLHSTAYAQGAFPAQVERQAKHRLTVAEGTRRA